MPGQSFMVITVKHGPSGLSEFSLLDIPSRQEKTYFLEIQNCCRVDLVILDPGSDPGYSVSLVRGLNRLIPRLLAIIISEMRLEEEVGEVVKSEDRDCSISANGGEFRKTVEALLSLKHRSPDEKPASQRNPREKKACRASADIPERLARAMIFIESNFSSPITLDNIAGAACTSKYHFCRLFKRHFGTSPMSYVIKLRVNRAIILLGRKDLPISLVAMRAGFSDLTEFNRQFRRFTGVSPSLFRKNMMESPPSHKSNLPPTDSNFPKAD